MRTFNAWCQVKLHVFWILSIYSNNVCHSNDYYKTINIRFISAELLHQLYIQNRFQCRVVSCMIIIRGNCIDLSHENIMQDGKWTSRFLILSIYSNSVIRLNDYYSIINSHSSAVFISCITTNVTYIKWFQCTIM